MPSTLGRLHSEAGRMQAPVKLALAVALASSFAASAARAQPAPSSQPATDARPALDAAPLPEPAVQREPASKKELDRAAPIDLAEMLRRVPGVQARQEYGGGGRLDISVRGLDAGRSRRVLMLEDGIPLSINPYSEPDMYFAPPVERMRGIEVGKGSGNILFGPQTIAGTINFLTLAPPDKRTVAADLDVGSCGYVRGLPNYGDSFGGARYVVQVLHRRGEGFRNPGFESTNGLAKLAFDTGENGEATIKLGFHRDESGSEDVGLTRDMYARDPAARRCHPRAASSSIVTTPRSPTSVASRRARS